MIPQLKRLSRVIAEHTQGLRVADRRWPPVSHCEDLLAHARSFSDRDPAQGGDTAAAGNGGDRIHLHIDERGAGVIGQRVRASNWARRWADDSAWGVDSSAWAARVAQGRMQLDTRTTSPSPGMRPVASASADRRQ